MIYLANTGKTKPVEILRGNISRAEVVYRIMGHCYDGNLWDLEADGGFYEIAAAIRGCPPEGKSGAGKKKKTGNDTRPRGKTGYPATPLYQSRMLKDGRRQAL